MLPKKLSSHTEIVPLSSQVLQEEIRSEIKAIKTLELLNRSNSQTKAEKEELLQDLFTQQL
jgi:hypothetical protein